jgi:acyl-CoA synthetase (AMP-forming)/AMP-acid ligase II
MHAREHRRKPFDSLGDIFRFRAEGQPDRWCYSFLRDGDGGEERVTYSEVDRRARRVAALIARHTEAGDRALLLYPPGLEFIYAFIGCLYAGVVAVPVAPPHALRLPRALPRLRAIVDDCGATLALTTSALHDPGRTAWVGHPTVRWLSTEDLAISRSARAPVRAPSDIAFLQYTSGTTGKPKAVVVTQENLLANEAMISEAFGSTPDAIGVGWLPFHHDMGLIGNVLHPPYAGYPVVLMTPLGVLQRPLRWLQAISRYRATVSGAPDFAFDLCARRVAPEDKTGLDLASWSVAFSGAETVRPATLERFAAAFAGVGFRSSSFLPCYGLAEATLIVTACARNRSPVVQAGPSGTARVSCGGALSNERVVIVDPATRVPVPEEAAGEVWISGGGVCRGYWNRRDETAIAFGARLADGDGPWLRTGDLGWLSGGELFIEGRIKDLVIVRGKNHHPQDIELTVENASPAVHPSSVVAFSVETRSGEELAVAAEIDPRTREPHERIAAVLRAALVEEHGLMPATLVLLPRGALPRTTSGKLQRSATAAAFQDGSLEVLAVFSRESAAF